MRRALSALLGLLFGAGAAWGLCHHWLALAPAPPSLLWGGLAGLLGGLWDEHLGEALVLSLVLGALTTLLVTTNPDAAVLRNLLAPAVTGLCTGKLLAGIGKEWFS